MCDSGQGAKGPRQRPMLMHAGTQKGFVRGVGFQSLKWLPAVCHSVHRCGGGGGAHPAGQVRHVPAQQLPPPAVRAVGLGVAELLCHIDDASAVLLAWDP